MKKLRRPRWITSMSSNVTVGLSCSESCLFGGSVAAVCDVGSCSCITSRTATGGVFMILEFVRSWGLEVCVNIALVFLSTNPACLYHCAHWRHRNTGLYRPAPDPSPSTCRCERRAWWLGISPLRSPAHILAFCWGWQTVFVSWFLPAAACTSTSGSSRCPLCGRSVLLHCRPRLPTVRVSGWRRRRQRDLCVLTVTVTCCKLVKDFFKVGCFSQHNFQ